MVRYTQHSDRGGRIYSNLSFLVHWNSLTGHDSTFAARTKNKVEKGNIVRPFELRTTSLNEKEEMNYEWSCSYGGS